ncbi:MAG: hypothetical protein ACYDC8_13365 [Gammaproteobacteria bacterium]
MNVEFCIESEASWIEANGLSEKILRTIADLEEDLLVLYEEIDRATLHDLSLIVTDGRPADTESSCTRITANPSVFRMRLVPNGHNAIEEIIAHELCHIMQMTAGKLLTISSEPHSVIWKGEKYCVTDLSYRRRPWEQEAMFNAQALF